MHTIFLTIIALLLLSAPAQAQESAPCPAPPLTFCAPTMLGQVAIREETAGHLIDMRYPVLCDADATATIRDDMTATLARFKAIDPEHDQSEFPHKYSMESEYSVWSAGAGRLGSVKIQIFEYTGGAHGMYWPETWVFNMADGEPLALDEILLDPQDALQMISAHVRTVLRSSLGNMFVPEMLQDGTRPTLSNFANYILSDEGMTFFFSPYQVAPFAAGESAVPLPWSMIRRYVKPEIRDLLSPSL